MSESGLGVDFSYLDVLWFYREEPVFPQEPHIDYRSQLVDDLAESISYSGDEPHRSKEDRS